MKAGHCLKCKSYGQCAKPCPRVYAEMKRAECGRKKKRVNIVYEHEMTGPMAAWWNQAMYGAGIDSE